MWSSWKLLLTSVIESSFEVSPSIETRNVTSLVGAHNFYSLVKMKLEKEDGKAEDRSQEEFNFVSRMRRVDRRVLAHHVE